MEYHFQPSVGNTSASNLEFSQRIEQLAGERNAWLLKAGGSLASFIALSAGTALLLPGRFMVVFYGLLMLAFLSLGQAWRSNQQLGHIRSAAKRGEPFDAAKLEAQLHEIRAREEKGLPKGAWVGVGLLMLAFAAMFVFGL